MADPRPVFDPVHRPVLEAVKPLSSAHITLAPVAEGTVLQVLGPFDRAADLRDAGFGAGISLRDNGPGQWFLVANEPNLGAELSQKLPAGFTGIDQSHGRVHIAVEGDAVEDVLSKGTGLDLAQFRPGAAATTLLGHVAVHLSRVSGDRFDLLVPRSFAVSVWNDLKIMAAEYLDPSNG